MLKRWVPASFIAVAMALALAGGAVLAVGRSHGPVTTDVLERAAAILGIEVSDLQSAHDQARRESLDDRIAEAVEMLVATEVITQEEADSFTTWMADRPDSTDEALLDQLTSSLIGSHFPGGRRLELHRHAPTTPDDITTRMAEILGLDPQDLADALNDGKTELAEQDRLSKLHAVVDAMLEKGSIDSREAEELHAWIDETPEWLLNLDVDRRAFGSFGMFKDRLDGSGFLKGFPFPGFGEREHFGDGERKFRFEFNGPDGTFEFDSEDGDFPFDDERLQELLEEFNIEPFQGFEGLGGPGDLEGLFERFRGHRFFGPHFEEFLPPTATPESDTTSA
jgi:hypothetical protein